MGSMSELTRTICGIALMWAGATVMLSTLAFATGNWHAVGMVALVCGGMAVFLGAILAALDVMTK